MIICKIRTSCTEYYVLNSTQPVSNFIIILKYAKQTLVTFLLQNNSVCVLFATQKLPESSTNVYMQFTKPASLEMRTNQSSYGVTVAIFYPFKHLKISNGINYQGHHTAGRNTRNHAMIKCLSNKLRMCLKRQIKLKQHKATRAH